MASFVKIFKRKTSKQNSLSDDIYNSAEIPSNSAINLDRKQIKASSSFRIHRKTHTQHCDCGKEANDGRRECLNAGEYSRYKSPYSVFTEPKIGRSARSCPVGPSSKEMNSQMRNIRKCSPAFDVQPTIHERSGSYENFTTSHLEQLWEQPKQHGREKLGKENEGGTERQRKNAEGSEEEKALEKRCKFHPAAHFHQHPPLSTSEYWSADPSPIGESRPHVRHFHVSHRPNSNGIREEMTMALVGLEMGKDEESSSEDGDNSSDDQQISPTALLQFWQQQVRVLKRELKSSRETAEKYQLDRKRTFEWDTKKAKFAYSENHFPTEAFAEEKMNRHFVNLLTFRYRNKYLRLKTKTDELSSELMREKERNIWLFNQLIATNDKMTQLNLAHIHFKGTQMRHNPLTMNVTEVAENGPFELIKDNRLGEGRKCEESAQHRSTAGEVQAELSSDDFDDKSTSNRGGNCGSENEHSQQIMDQRQKRQSQSIRTPTPVPPDNANGSPNGLLMGNFFCTPAVPFFNLNSFNTAQQIRNQLHVEVARGGHLDSARNSNSRLISPPTKKGAQKADKDTSPITIEEDENEEQLKHEEEEEEDNDSLGADLEENGPIVIPLDTFCHQQIEQKKINKESVIGRTTMSVKLLLRNCRSSEDLRSSADNDKGTIGSSSEDDIRMWKKQLRSRGERVLFRPSRKTLFSGVFGNEKGPNKFFRRFGQPEREALAKFDYLHDERTDVSGLMSSPEKIND